MNQDLHGSRRDLGGIPRPMDQTTARRLAKERTEATGQVHIAAAVPLGCWGGTEDGWDVFSSHEPDRVKSS